MIAEPQGFHADAGLLSGDATIYCVTQNAFIGQDTGRD